MQPTSPFVVNQDGEPNLELLRRMGWSLGTLSGSYCVAWRGHDEVLFEWKAGGWYRVGGGRLEDEAA
jgi:hypothetical protein